MKAGNALTKKTPEKAIPPIERGYRYLSRKAQSFLYLIGHKIILVMTTAFPVLTFPDQRSFHQLIADHRNQYLRDNQYYEKLAKSRNPRQVMQDTISDLHHLINQIQARPAMRDVDPVKNAHGYVPTIIKDLFAADKDIHPYEALLRYCALRGKDPNTIIPHIAEYRAVNQLAKKINRHLNPRPIRKAIAPGPPDDSFPVNIIRNIYAFGRSLAESAPRIKTLNEEECRDHFVAFLRAIKPDFSITAETFSRSGRTDMLITGSNSSLVIECKHWRGPSYFKEAIGQLLKGYLTHSSQNAAILVFNKTFKDFTVLGDKASKILAQYPGCVKVLEKKADGWYSFLFQHPLDAGKTIRLDLVLSHFL